MRDPGEDGRQLTPLAGGTLTRREFIRRAALCAGCAAVGGGAGPRPGVPAAKAALYWESLPGGATRCLLCPNLCTRASGQTGQCRTRVNRDGRWQTLTHGNPCVIREDHLSKNPLYHVDPGAVAIGVATAGCNLACKYCQNWDISQVGPESTHNMDLSPEALVAKTKQRGLKWLTFSYTEPVVYFEYAMDAARLAHREGIRVAAVTAGYIRPEPLADMMKAVDAFSITLKGHNDAFYREVCGCPMENVLATLRSVAGSSRWLEVVYLPVPGLNDSPEAAEEIAARVAALGRDIPLHILRFSPAFKLTNLPRTPLKTLELARDAARSAGLKYVYLDLPGHADANTVCPGCGKTLIERSGFAVLSNRLRNKACPFCSTRIPGLL
jgi:pyruvate formate lyase activating enzyme